ncbi:GNAT family N-acetyltransferase [Sphaerotilus hippei]|uniref:GNAT family N-acetyltransferase n=1 Tax=Sphaerotilus hippei TaxID=744406 RepID=UPI00147467AD|nr:GNAT family N-acetyltransferase [Sphaerotilus hippei]
MNVTWSELPAPAELERRWRGLECKADASFFITWAWIGLWLERLPEGVRPRLLQACLGDRVVGLAVVVRGPVRRRAGLPICETWHLHATGQPSLDSLTIEHNDFLIDRDGGDEVRGAMLAHWVSQAGASAEFSLPGVSPAVWHGELHRFAARGLCREDHLRPSYTTDLRVLRDQGLDALSLPSNRTRTQIRRSIKEYATLGDVTLDEPASLEQALQWLDALAELHQSHWTSRGQPGAFSNPFFLGFHREMMRRCWADGTAEVLRVRAGPHALSYLYSFVHRGRVLHYQAGLEYGLIGKLAKPGLVSHVIASRHHIAKGRDIYDYMVGDSRYKDVLCNRPEQLQWTCLRTRSWRLRAESTLRRWRDACRRRVAPVAAAAEPADES